VKSKGEFVNFALIVMPMLFFSSAVVCLLNHGQGRAFQYIFLFLLCVFWLELELMSGYKSKVLLPIMIVLSLRYYNRKFTWFSYFSCVAALLASVFCNAYLYKETGFIDLNLVRLEVPQQMTISGFLYDNIIQLNPSSSSLVQIGMILTFLPNTIFLTVITVLSNRFMNVNLENIVKSQEIASREADQRVQLSDMKTKLLLSQIQPHFIYNTLTTIAYFCDEDPKKAEDLTNRFSEYLRANLSSLTETRMVLFSKELDAVKNYLEIERYRFEDRVKVEYHIQTESFAVPVLSIQPIVENAVKHGLCKKKGGGTIVISTAEDGENYFVTIQDDGVGFDKDQVGSDGKTHVGIQNVTARIRSAGGEISIDSRVNVGTTVVIRFPKEEAL